MIKIQRTGSGWTAGLLAAALVFAGAGTATRIHAQVLRLDDKPTTTATTEAKTKGAGVSSPAAMARLRQLEAKNQDLTSMVGTFRQKKTNELFSESHVYDGKFEYAKPSKFRLDYTGKDGQADESTLLMLESVIWNYVPSINQATCVEVRRSRGRQIEINQILLGYGVKAKVADEFFVVTEGPGDPKNEVFTLVFTARSLDETMQFEKATITFDAKDLRPKTIRLDEPSGDVTEIELGGVRFNEAISDARFLPNWPDGTEFVGPCAPKGKK